MSFPRTRHNHPDQGFYPEHYPPHTSHITIMLVQIIIFFLIFNQNEQNLNQNMWNPLGCGLFGL